MIFPFSLFITQLSLLCFFAQLGFCASTNIEGIILTDKGALNGASVSAYPDFKSLLSRSNRLSSVPGEKIGQYRLSLPAGHYYLVAEGIDSAGNYFSYHGLNPVTVDTAPQWIPFFATLVKQPSCKKGEYQGIGGQVSYKGQPVANGAISLYSIADEPFRGMGLLTNTLNSNGEYWFDLEPGNYVLVARQRLNQAGIGPIQQGDLFCYSSANPVKIQEGFECEVDLSCYPRNDIEHFLSADADDPRGKKETNRRAASLKDTAGLDSEALPAQIPKRPATLSGQVSDLDGTPRPGLIVTAYAADDLPLFQMYIVRFKSQYMAQTDSKGRYSLDLSNGSYYLVAREFVGVAPTENEYYGLYEGTANHNIVIRAGENRGDADIIVGRIMP